MDGYRRRGIFRCCRAAWLWKLVSVVPVIYFNHQRKGISHYAILMSNDAFSLMVSITYASINT